MSKLATTSLTKNEVANSKQTVKYAQNRLDHDRRNATPVLNISIWYRQKSGAAGSSMFIMCVRKNAVWDTKLL